jgi:outer membrane protein assembly factor BamB
VVDQRRILIGTDRDNLRAARLQSARGNATRQSVRNEIMRYGWCGVLVVLAGCGRPPIPPTAEVLPETTAATAISDIARPQWSTSDWPGWRGPNHDGVAIGTEVPVEWSETQNVLWKTKIPGRGHSSPIVVGDRIYLATADERQAIQAVLAIDRRRGKPIWQTDLFTGGFERERHHTNTHASSTLATDGERLFATFLNDRRIWCSALDLEGQELWRKEVGGFRSKQGYSASPLVYQSLVIVAADHSAGGFVAGLHRQSGEIVWRRNRPAKDSYASPQVVHLGGVDQLVISGCDVITSYEPLTGKTIWSTQGTTESTVGTAVATKDVVIVAGGWPDAGVVALRPDGGIAWQNREKVYVPSMLVYEEYVYAVRDDGIARCWNAATGKDRWKQRLNGEFRASPVILGDRIFIVDMAGKTTVFRANPERFELIAENTLGTEAFATPAISAGQIFLRVADDAHGSRQEYLYCIGASPLTTSRAR